MRVGVYVDGYNLYYGGRTIVGRGLPGWRWLDVRAVSQDLLAKSPTWVGATLERIVYCTARVDSVTAPEAFRDQDIYLKALKATQSVDHIEYGHYVSRVKSGLLATKDANGKPEVHTSRWPLMVRDADGSAVKDAQFLVQYLFTEEKGSDVNVAAHLLTDVISGTVDAAIVISNDSDLRLPIQQARGVVPVGLVNPRGGYLAGDLRGRPGDGVGNHWWKRLDAQDFLRHQLPSPAAGYPSPQGW